MTAFSSPVLSRVIVVVRNLAFVREIHPVVLEDVLHLQFEQTGVGEDVATAAENARLFVIHHRGREQVIQFVGFVDQGGHGRLHLAF